MREFKLKNDVDEKTLASRGFNIVTTGKEKIAVKNFPDPISTETKTIIIYLIPSKRVVQWRYVSMANVPLEPYIQDFIDLIEMDESIQPKQENFGGINDWAREIHGVAIAHGFWEKEPSFGDVCSLIHSEVSKAYEEYRKKARMFFIEDGKPEGVAIELVDVVLSVLDYLEAKGVNIEALMQLKHDFNKTSPYKHGGKRV